MHTDSQQMRREDLESKKRALDIIMQHYSGSPSADNEEAVHKAAIIKVKIEHICIEMSGFPPLT